MQFGKNMHIVVLSVIKNDAGTVLMMHVAYGKKAINSQIQSLW